MEKRILIVDDEADIRTFLTALFEDHGYAVDTAAHGREAGRKVAEKIPDLICLDLFMPEKSGVAFYRELKKNRAFQRIPVVMVTGFKEESYPLAAFKKFVYEESVPGPEAYLEKPIDRDLLLKKVFQILSGEEAPPQNPQERRVHHGEQENSGH